MTIVNSASQPIFFNPMKQIKMSQFVSSSNLNIEKHFYSMRFNNNIKLFVNQVGF